MSLRHRLCLIVLAAAACSDDGDRNPCASIDTACTAIPVGAGGEEIQTAFVTATPGQTIGFGAGRYPIDRDLSLTVPNVRLVGAGSGEDGTILAFDDSTGAQGILITGDASTVEHLGVENTPGDSIKWEGVDGVTVRDVRVEWTNGPAETNGAYGLYPVQCADVLIEESYVRGASDAGIYVGQSDNIVVRNNVATENVAGIEIENSTRADVYDNTATKNTGGLLVFSLPGLQVANGRGTRVFGNRIVDNNTTNFAPAGNIVGLVPTGTGIALLAAHEVEIFDNDIENHLSIHIGIIGYGTTMRPFTDPNYDAFTDTIHIHDNRIVGRAMAPTGDLGAFLIIALGEASINPNATGVPDVVWDGDADPAKVDGAGNLMSQYALCIKNNTRAGAAIDFANLRVPLRTDPVPTTDLAPHDCTLPALPAVTLP
jgi:parallel beta-helix repeat protein